MTDLKTVEHSAQTGLFNYPRSQLLDSGSDRWSYRSISSVNLNPKENGNSDSKFFLSGPRPWGAGNLPAGRAPKPPSSPELDRPNPFTKKVPEASGPKVQVIDNQAPRQPFSRFDKGYSSMNALNKTSPGKSQTFGLGIPRNTYARSSLTPSSWSQKEDKSPLSFTRTVDIDIDKERSQSQNPYGVKSGWIGNQRTQGPGSTQLHRAEVAILREDSSTDSEAESHMKPTQSQKVEDKSKDPNNEFLSVKMQNLKQRRLLEQKDKEIEQLIRKLKDEDTSKGSTLPQTSNSKPGYQSTERTAVGMPREKPTYYFGDKSSSLTQKATPQQQKTYQHSIHTPSSSATSSTSQSLSSSQPSSEQKVSKLAKTQSRSIPVQVHTLDPPKVEVPKVIHIPITIIRDEKEEPKIKGPQTEALGTKSVSQSSSSSAENLNIHPYVNLQSLHQQSTTKEPLKAEIPRYFRKNVDQKPTERPKSDYFSVGESHLQPNLPLSKSLTASNLVNKSPVSYTSGYTPVVPQPGTSKSLWNVSNTEKSHSLTQSQKLFSMSKPTDLDSIDVVRSAAGPQLGILRPINSVNPKIQVTHANEPLYQNLGPGFPPTTFVSGKQSDFVDDKSSSEEEKVISDPAPGKKSILTSKLFKLGTNKNKEKSKKEDFSPGSSSDEEDDVISDEKPKKKKGFASIFKKSKGKVVAEKQASPSASQDSESSDGTDNDEQQHIVQIHEKVPEDQDKYENLPRTLPFTPKQNHQQQKGFQNANKISPKAEVVQKSSSEQDEISEDEKPKKKKGFASIFKKSKGKVVTEKQASPSASQDSESSDETDNDEQQEIAVVQEKVTGPQDHYENLRRNSPVAPERQAQAKVVQDTKKSQPKVEPAQESSSDDDEVFTNEDQNQKKGAQTNPAKGKAGIKKQSSPSVSQASEASEDSGPEQKPSMDKKRMGGKIQKANPKVAPKGHQSRPRKRESPPSTPEITEDSQSDSDDQDKVEAENLSSEAEESYDKMHNFRESPKTSKKKGFSGLFSSSKSSGKATRKPPPSQREEAEYISDNGEQSEPQRPFNSRQRRNSQGFGSLFGSKRKAKRFQQQQRQQARDEQRRGSVYSGHEASGREDQDYDDQSDREMESSMSRRRRDTSFSGFFGSARGNPSKAKSMGNLADQGARRNSGSRIGLQAGVSTGSLSRPKRDKSFGGFLGTPKSRQKQMQRSATQPALNGTHSNSESDQEQRSRSASEDSLRSSKNQRSVRPKSTSNIHDEMEVDRVKHRGSNARRDRDISSEHEESENDSHMSVIHQSSSAVSRTNSYRQAHGSQRRRRPPPGLPANFNSLPRMKQREIRQRLEQQQRQQQDDYDDDVYDRQSLQHRRRPRQNDPCSLM